MTTVLTEIILQAIMMENVERQQLEIQLEHDQAIPEQD